MATVKLILRPVANKDGQYPVAIRIIKNRKVSYIHLGYALDAADWDEASQRVKASHPTAKRLNNLLLKKLSDATNTALEAETQREDVSVRAIRQKIKPSAGATFVPQAQAFLDLIKSAGKFNRYTAERVHLNRFLRFSKDIAFSDITPLFLSRFTAFMRATGTIGERSNANSISFVRDVYSRAIQAGLVDAKLYPFGKGKAVIKIPETAKVGLNPAEVAALEAGDFKPKQQHAVNLWLFSYYNAGMRISDVLRLKWTDVQDGRLHYVMGKNKKAGSVKLHEKALAILEQYPKEDEYIFPELRGLTKQYAVERQIALKVGKLDKWLRAVAELLGITKKLTMHISRHSFAQVASDKINIRVLQKLYRHSSIKTTVGYQSNFITKDADDAIDSVLNS